MKKIRKGLSLLLALLLALSTVGAIAPTRALAAEAEEETAFDRAMLQINGVCWNFAYADDDVRVWYYDEETEEEVEKTAENFPAGVSYDLDSNTLTLKNASLTSLELGYMWIEDKNGEPTGHTDQWLPNANLTIELVGDNTIGFTTAPVAGDNEAIDPGANALTLSWGVNAVLSGSGSLTLNTVASEGAEGYAIPLMLCNGSGLTLDSGVRVTATVGGVWNGWQDENGNPSPAELAAVSSSHWMANQGNAITIREGASLTLNGGRAVEFHNGDKLTVNGGTLNANGSVLLEKYDDDLDARGAFTVSGGVVRIDATAGGTKTGMDGIRLGQADLTVTGGSLTVQAAGSKPYLFEDGEDSWYTVEQGCRGICVECGSTMTVSGGEVTVDFTSGTGIAVGSDGETANAFTQTGGTVRVSSSEKEGEANALQVDGTGHSGGNVAEFRGGTTTLKGTLAMSVDGSGRTYPGVVNLRAGAGVTVNTTKTAYEYMHNWGVISLSGGELNVYGGALTVNAENACCININWDRANNFGSYTQTGGTVSLSSKYARDCGPYDYETGEGTNLQALGMETGSAAVSGGTLNIDSDYDGLVAGGTYVEENDFIHFRGAHFTLTGGEVNILAKVHGVWTYLDGHVDLQGGSMQVEAVLTEEERAGAYQGCSSFGFWSSTVGFYDGFVPDDSLTVTGGAHSFTAAALGGTLDAVDGNGDYTYEPFSAGIYARGTANFHGGSVTAGGDYAVLSENFAGTENRVALGDGMHAVSESGTELTMVGRVAAGYRNNFDDRWFTYTENSRISGPVCKQVTISPTAGTTEPEATLSLEATSGQATAGAPVSFKAVVSGKGDLLVSLPDGVEYLEGTFSIDGELVKPDISGNEIRVELDGKPHVIRFQVTAEATEDNEPHVITASLCMESGPDIYTSSASFSVSPFDAAAPTVTKVTTVPVTGHAAPGWTVNVTATSKKTYISKSFTGMVTELGTFAVDVELPVNDPTVKEDFDITVTVQPPVAAAAYGARQSTTSVTLSCTYDPDSVTVRLLTITNKVHYKGTKVEVTTTVENGLCFQSYYTYWPDEPNFSFAVEFEVPDGYEVVQAVVEVVHMSGRKTYVPLEKPGPGDHDLWKGEEESWNDPPVRFRVGWQAVPAGQPYTPVNIKDLCYGAPAGFLPIMDPSGVVYDGSEDTPVAGATVTLYYGGNGETADAANAEVFDMTPYGQVNPQITNELGQYGWNVPSGWWKIVAVYVRDGKTYTAESEWLHVLPVQEGVGLNLNLSSQEPVIPVIPSVPGSSSGSAATEPETGLPFRDVSGWYYDDVAYVYENGIMGGVSSARFDPSGTLTRGMVVTMLHRLEGEPNAKAGTFTDVARDLWYTAAIDWAAETGLVTGYDSENFGPNDPITREQLATILYRYAKWKGMDVSGRTGLNAFADASQVSAYAMDAMEWAVSAGILNGSSGKLLPQGNATRAEAAAMFHRFMEG